MPDLESDHGGPAAVPFDFSLAALKIERRLKNQE
jgi:hypothetical protein